MAQPKYVGKMEWPVTVQLNKGLEGAITNETEIGYVDGEKGWLVYRGYNIFDLAEHSTYEETAYLLLFGKLPKQAELEEFKKKLVANRAVPGKVMDVLRDLPKQTHPMAALRTGVSVLGCLDPNSDKGTIESETEISIKLVAQMATIGGAIARIRKGLKPVDPDPSLDHTANYMLMTLGQKPDELTEKVMDVAMILHADHGMNNSTFSTMCIHSTLSDMYSAIVGGIASLKGPLHGGANEQALAELLKLKDEEDASRYVKGCIAQKKKIMGFGHRVYKAYDPRARILGKFSKEVTEKMGMGHLYRIAKRMEDEVIAACGEKGIFPNVDFYSGTIYYAFGIEPAMFTPIFAVSRIAGWCARVLEYIPINQIFRPRAMSVGQREIQYVTMDQR